MLAAVVDAARKVLHAERGSVFLYDATSNELVLKVATGLAPIRVPADRGKMSMIGSGPTGIRRI